MISMLDVVDLGNYAWIFAGTLHERTHKERCSANAAGAAKRLHV